MLRVDCYEFYKLAFHIHPLTTLENDLTLSDSWAPLYMAKSEIFSFFNVFPLRTTLPPGRALYQALRAIVPDDLTQMRWTEEDGSRRLLSWVEANLIRTTASEFETVLKAELNGWDTFFVSQKGGYSTTDLISNAEKLLPEAAQIYLSAEALEDVRQCGRCLAFNLGTAAAFHIVRAAETYIRRYYEYVTGTQPTVKSRNWGAYIKTLQAAGKGDPKVLGWMRQIKDEYRNPVLHPEEIVDPDSALEFVNACISLMATISRSLLKGGAVGIAPLQGQLSS